MLFDPLTRTWDPLDIVGDVLPTMDHRGLVRVGEGWATVGGMVGPGTATDQVVFYQLVPEPTGGLLLLIGMLVLRRR